MTNLKKCSLCGMCKSNCPIFKATLEERYSPRAKSIILKEEKLATIFFDCTLCGACKAKCPAGVDMKLRKVREELEKKGTNTSANKKMIENIRKYGNPFGKVKKGEEQKDLYCC